MPLFSAISLISCAAKIATFLQHLSFDKLCMTDLNLAAESKQVRYETNQNNHSARKKRKFCSVRTPQNVNQCPFSVRSLSVRCPFVVRSLSVRSPFCLRSGSVFCPFFNGETTESGRSHGEVTAKSQRSGSGVCANAVQPERLTDLCPSPRMLCLTDALRLTLP